MNRKPDGRSQLNRLSKDRQAAVADYAARHTLPETVEWLKSPGWPPDRRAASQTTAPATPSPPAQLTGTPVSPAAVASAQPALAAIASAQAAPPAQPQGISVSRSALARWLSGYRMRDQCAQNRHTVAALVKDLRAARPAWTPGEVHQAAQAFFEALALHRQETRLWALTQRLDLRRAQLELATAKHKESRRSKLSMGLDTIAEAFRENPQALKLYEQARELVEPDCVQEQTPQTKNTR